MLSVPHPEVLAPDFVPPVALGRNGELARLAELLGAGDLAGPSPRVAEVVGPSGAGTSAVARLAARRLLEGIRRHGAPTPPLFAAVRVRRCRGTVGVASALVQTFDEGFDGHGFPAAEVLAGFLRRLRRDARPAVLVLDDLGPSAPDLEPILKGFARPDRFLPEGESGLPPIRLILAGVPEAEGVWRAARRAGFERSARVELPPYAYLTLEAIVEDRLVRALGRPAPPGMATEIAERAHADTASASRALELLRRILFEGGGGPRPAVPAACRDGLYVEPRILEALHRALAGGPVSLGELKRWEARLADLDGARPLPATTLWRRLLRLEAEGLIHRRVRMGGEGGTRSVLELTRPFTDWPVRPALPGSRPTVVHAGVAAHRAGGRPHGAMGPEPFPPHWPPSPRRPIAEGGPR